MFGGGRETVHGLAWKFPIKTVQKQEPWRNALHLEAACVPHWTRESTLATAATHTNPFTFGQDISGWDTVGDVKKHPKNVSQYYLEHSDGYCP